MIFCSRCLVLTGKATPSSKRASSTPLNNSTPSTVAWIPLAHCIAIAEASSLDLGLAGACFEEPAHECPSVWYNLFLVGWNSFSEVAIVDSCSSFWSETFESHSLRTLEHSGEVNCNFASFRRRPRDGSRSETYPAGVCTELLPTFAQARNSIRADYFGRHIEMRMQRRFGVE